MDCGGYVYMSILTLWIVDDMLIDCGGYVECWYIDVLMCGGYTECWYIDMLMCGGIGVSNTLDAGSVGGYYPLLCIYIYIYRHTLYTYRYNRIYYHILIYIYDICIH